MAYNFRTHHTYLFSTQSSLKLFLTLPIWLIYVSNHFPGSTNNLQKTMSLKVNFSVFSTCFVCKVQTLFEISVLTFFHLLFPEHPPDILFEWLFPLSIFQDIWYICGNVCHLKLALLKIFKLAVITLFPFNVTWNSSWQFIFGWLLLVIIFQVSTRIFSRIFSGLHHWKVTFCVILCL